MLLSYSTRASHTERKRRWIHTDGLKLEFMANEDAQQRKSFSVKPATLNSIPRTYIEKEKDVTLEGFA